MATQGHNLGILLTDVLSLWTHWRISSAHYYSRGLEGGLSKLLKHGDGKPHDSFATPGLGIFLLLQIIKNKSNSISEKLCRHLRNTVNISYIFNPFLKKLHVLKGLKYTVLTME